MSTAKPSCSWCDELSVAEVVLEPARKGRDKRTGSMVEKKPAKKAFVCQAHKDIVDRQPPFYTCGCSYVEGELRCTRHQSLLRSPHRERLAKEVVKHGQNDGVPQARKRWGGYRS